MRRLRVSYFNEQDFVDITPEIKRLLKSGIKQAMIFGGFDKDSEVSVSFVTNDRIREINRDFRNIDSPTDVLSFPLADNCEFDINPDSGLYTLGDIIISTQRASEQASEIGHSVQREMAFLVIHSTLHIIGYDHHDEDGEDTKLMRRKEREVIAKLGI